MAVAAFILGFKDGFIRKLIGTIGFLLAVILGIRLSAWGGSMVRSLTQFETDFADALGGFFVFLLIILITSIIKRVVHPFDKVNNLINRLIGGGIGILQILLLVSALLNFMDVFKLPPDKVRNESWFYKPVKGIYSTLFSALKNVTPNFQKSLEKLM